MHPSVRRALAGAVLATGGIAVLAGCTDSADQPVTSPTSTPLPSTPLPSTPLPPYTQTGAPLGLEIRYVNADGDVVILEPKDFPH